jgi:hypothetical protein
MHQSCKGHVKMTIAEQHRVCALREEARARQARRGFSVRPRLRVHVELYLYIEGLPEVRKPEYLE